MLLGAAGSTNSLSATTDVINGAKRRSGIRRCSHRAFQAHHMNYGALSMPRASSPSISFSAFVTRSGRIAGHILDETKTGQENRPGRQMSVMGSSDGYECDGRVKREKRANRPLAQRGWRGAWDRPARRHDAADGHRWTLLMRARRAHVARLAQ